MVASESSEHRARIHRLLRGEIINGEVGITLRGGPFDGKIRIIRLDHEGRPPARTGGWRGGMCHRYVLVSEEGSAPAWYYQYEGSHPEQPPL
ncbi:hypothetical protein GCM10010174_02910 [Kutzneria viridogrisea]|uniref:Uncharacterized protein n=2 Tax=Kutzneria TaxID=43356 RepID=W5W9Y4_9PSEU|nr:hypothetical protein [Kutzneria albida]AHH97570.1 hypothetical protein KALB_4207 [Kutzneria albida DSM 43870]MBA8924807.1 hypothetical protein [Kutzneria viridogrisea]MBA8930493.1 hypothetical protein [Kutzneria viridogrisea]